VRRKLIGTLSKGYRQRVGLADALINEPDILHPGRADDRPRSRTDQGGQGADPGLATRHTILISSHILSEVEMTCSRVLILDKGRIVASGTPAELRERAGLPLAGSIRIELKATAPEALEAFGTLRSAGGVGSVRVTGSDGDWTELEIVPGKGDPREEIFRTVVARGWQLRELASQRSSLEEIFASFVKTGGRSSREEKP